MCRRVPSEALVDCWDDEDGRWRETQGVINAGDCISRPGWRGR